MSWIDKKYKEQFEDEQFSDELKHKGWEKLQPMLNSEMPVSGGRGPSAVAWKLGLGGLLVGGLVVSTIWLTSSSDAESETEKYYTPRVEVAPLVGMDEDEDEKSGSTSFNIDSEDITRSEASQMSESPGLKREEVKVLPNPAAVVSGKAATTGKTDFEAATSSTDQQVAELAAPAEPDDEVQNEEVPAETPSEGSEHVAAQSLIEQEKEASVASFVSEPVFTATEEKSTENKAVDPAGDTKSESQEQPIIEPVTESAEILTAKDEKAVTSDQKKTTVVAGAEERSLESGHKNDLQMAEKDGEALEIPAIADEKIGENRESQGTSDVQTEQPDSEVKIEASKDSDQNLYDWHLAFPGVASQDDLELPSLSGRRLAVSISAGYYHVDKLLESESSAYLKKRLAEERAIQNFTTSIELDYFLDRNWTFGIGFSYSEYGEFLNYRVLQRDTAYLDGRYNDPHTYRDNLVGLDSTRVIDSINTGHWDYRAVYEKEDTSVTANNGRTSFIYAEIPLTMGYRFGSGRLKTWIRSGVSLGIPIQASYRYLNLEASGLAEEQGLKSLAPLQWNALLQIGIDYKVSRHWSLRLNTSGSMQLNSVLQSESVKQCYYRLGGSFGLAYNF